MKKFLTFVILGLSTNLFAINPVREYTRTPEAFGIKYSQYKIQTPDKYEINVWEYSVIDNVLPAKTIILVGPDAGNMGFLIWQAKMLRDQGIRVIAFDYRGFGESSDFPIIKENLYHSEFSTDLDTVIKSTKTKYPTEKIGLYALSMGTYISLIRKEKIDFLIGEGFFNDPIRVTERIKLTKGKIVNLPTGFAEVKKLKPAVPVLIFCATEDKTTITADAIVFKKRNKVSIVEFKGEHLTGISTLTKDNPEENYAELISNFLTRNKI